MANLIQVKRSTTNASPASLTAGELAYSFLNTSNSLFVGNTSAGGPIRIAGGNYIYLHQSNTSAPGTLTANAVVIVDGNSFISAWKTNSLTVGVDGETVAISNISTFANTTQLGGSAGGANTELTSSWAVKTYVDGKVSAAIPVLTNTYIGVGNSSSYLGGTAAFTFNSTTNILSVGNTTVNTQISQTAITTTATIAAGNTTVTGFATISGTTNTAALNVSGVTATGNTTVTGFVNASSYGTFGGTVNAAALNISGVTSSGNVTVTGFVNVSSYGRFGGAVNATALNISGLTTSGNVTVTGFINSSSYGTFGGVVNATSFNSTGTATSTFANNVTITGVVNATSINTGDLSVTGNLTVSGTLTTVNANNLTVSDSLIQVAVNNNITPDILDIGLYGNFGIDGVSGNHVHTGLFRDASDGIWKLFTNLAAAPTTTVDTSNATFTYATLKTHLQSGGSGAGGLIANATTIAITANATLNVAIVANTLTLSTALNGASGGTGLSTYTAEDIIVANSTNGFRKLSVGTEGYILQVASGVVAWNTLDGGSF